MFAWLKALFGSMDRQSAAAERAAQAMEDIATDLESVRDQFRVRLGIEAPTPVVVTPLPAAKATDDEPTKARGKGK
jgi:hypothetical protein